MINKIAYITSRFPKVTETFVLFEILELYKLGMEIEVISLILTKEEIVHQEVEELTKKIHFANIISFTTLWDNLYWFFQSPKIFSQTFSLIVRENLKSPPHLLRAIIVMLLSSTFARKMELLGIEYIHSHWATHPTLAAFIINQFTGLPYSFTTHANDLYVNQYLLAEKIKNANFVVTISEFNRQYLLRLYPQIAAGKIEVIHCGIDTDVFFARPVNYHKKIFTIVCLARLEEEKGQKYLIEACAQLERKGIEFQCLLIGNGKMYGNLTNRIQLLRMSNRIKLMGSQPQNKVIELLATANIMILPSIITKEGRMEGIPVALMESLAMEIPVIATDISGVSELIIDGDTGLLIPQKDTNAIVRAIMEYYQNQELAKKFAFNGRKKVLEEFNLKKNSLALYNLIQKE